MTERIHRESRETWLAARDGIRGIGASEAAASAGESKRLTRMGLWQVKTGRKAPKDLSGLEVVQRGVRMEGAVRTWFAACHPELTVKHFPFDILYQTERPWLFATLDGETVDNETGEEGILEIKTAEPRTRADWEIWENGVPMDYYCQVLHQHLATKRRKLWLVAALWHQNGDVTIREYPWTVDDGFALDAQWLLGQEEKFMRYVEAGKIPPTPIKF